MSAQRTSLAERIRQAPVAVKITVPLAIVVAMASCAWLAWEIAMFKPLDGSWEYRYELRKGLDYARAMQFDKAVKHLRSAMQNAETSDAGAAAAQLMGGMIVTRARSNPGKYADDAGEHLAAILKLAEHNVPLRREILRNALDVSIMTGDLRNLSDSARALVAVAGSDVEKADVYKTWIEACIEKGSYRETKAVVEQAKAALPGIAGDPAFQLFDIQMTAGVAVSTNWFAEFRAENPSAGAKDARAALFDQAVRMTEQRRNKYPAKEDECDYMAGYLHFKMGDFKKAEKYLGDFVEGLQVKNRDRALVMLSAIWRMFGDNDVASDYLRLAFRAYGAHSVEAADEAATLSKSLAAGGGLAEALEFMLAAADRYPPGGDRWISAYCDASRLSAELGRDDEAWAHYKTAASSSSVSRHAVIETLLLEQTDRYLMNGKYPIARRWVMTYLDDAEDNNSYAAGLYRLFEVMRHDNTPSAIRIATGISAISFDATSERSAGTVIAVASEMEDAGGYKSAKHYYEKVAKLALMESSGGEFASAETVWQAVAGQARCHIRLGEVVAADRLLRDAARARRSGPAAMESAYWWATIATDAGQSREALRRLSTVGTNGCPLPLVAMVQIEEKLAHALTGTVSVALASEAFEKVQLVPEREQLRSIQRIARIMWAGAERSGNGDVMAGIMARLAECEIGPASPAPAIATRIAALKLADAIQASGASVAVRDIIGGSGKDVAEKNGDLLDVSRKIIDAKTKVDKFISAEE